MPGVERQGDKATCGDANTGSSTVFVNGKGVTRVEVDTAGALILGPGSQTVFCEGSKVSLPGDAIVGHGIFPHSSPVTASPSDNVFAGAGFATAPVVDDQGQVTEPATEGVENIDVRIVSLDQTTPVVPNTPSPPPAIPTYYIGPLNFEIRIANVGIDPAGAFSVTLYETDNITYFADGDPITLPSTSPLVGTDFTVVGTQEITSLDPGEEKDVVITLPAETVEADTPRFFTAFVDVGEALVESNELNGIAPIEVLVVDE